MGKPINNKTKNFDELLEHLNKPSDDLDAFEQEALEGFALLENKQEVIDLKNRLDEKMEKEVFVKKRKPLFIYWSAAAGIALLLGLIFIFNNTNSFEKKEMAQNNTPQEKSKSLEGNPPATSDETSREDKPDKNSKLDDISNLKKASNKAAEQDNEQQKEFRQSSDASGALAESAGKNAPAVTNEESEKPGKDADDKKSQDDFAFKDQQNEPQAARSAPASGAGAGDIAKSKNEDKEANTNSADAVFSRRIKKEKSIEAETKSPKPSEKIKSEIEGPFEKSTIKPASLTISESELSKLITKFLVGKDYKKSFTCILTINNSNKVEEVVFTDKDLFKKSEAKEITNFFKKQKCFKSNEYALYSTYKIIYISE